MRCLAFELPVEYTYPSARMTLPKLGHQFEEIETVKVVKGPSMKYVLIELNTDVDDEKIAEIGRKVKSCAPAAAAHTEQSAIQANNLIKVYKNDASIKALLFFERSTFV